MAAERPLRLLGAKAVVARDWGWRTLGSSEKLLLWYSPLELLDEFIWIEVHADRIRGKGVTAHVGVSLIRRRKAIDLKLDSVSIR